MSLESVLNEIREFAYECIEKQREECLSVSDSVIENYLKSIMYEQDFQIFLRHKELMLKEFRKAVKESLEWLNE